MNESAHTYSEAGTPLPALQVFEALTDMNRRRMYDPAFRSAPLIEPTRDCVHAAYAARAAALDLARRVVEHVDQELKRVHDSAPGTVSDDGVGFDWMRIPAGLRYELENATHATHATTQSALLPASSGEASVVEQEWRQVFALAVSGVQSPECAGLTGHDALRALGAAAAITERAAHLGGSLRVIAEQGTVPDLSIDLPTFETDDRLFHATRGVLLRVFGEHHGEWGGPPESRHLPVVPVHDDASLSHGLRRLREQLDDARSLSPQDTSRLIHAHAEMAKLLSEGITNAAPPGELNRGGHLAGALRAQAIRLSRLPTHRPDHLQQLVPSDDRSVRQAATCLQFLRQVPTAPRSPGILAADLLSIPPVLSAVVDREVAGGRWALHVPHLNSSGVTRWRSESDVGEVKEVKEVKEVDTSGPTSPGFWCQTDQGLQPALARQLRELPTPSALAVASCSASRRADSPPRAPHR